MNNILLIDDDRDFRNAIRAILPTATYTVIEAETAEAGSCQARQRLPDLILCDLHLGQGSGLNVLQDLRDDPVTATLPLIIITASDDVSVLRRSMELGADDFLHKPFTGEQLRAAVETRLKKQSVLKAQAEQRNRQLLNLLESTGDVVAIVDPQTREIRYLNWAARRLTGLNPASGGPPLRLSALYLPRAFDDLERLGLPYAMSQGTWSGESELTNGHGGAVYVMQEIKAPRLPDGTVEFLSIIAHDITRQRETTQALVRERILMRTLIDALPDCIYAKDRAARKTLANLADVRAMGADSEQAVLGKTDFDLLDREAAVSCYADDQRVILHGEAVIDREELVTSANGQQVWLETTKLPLRDDHGQIVGLVGIGHDITERRRAAEQLRKLSVAVEQSPASVVITDTTGCIEYVNPKFCILTGYGPAEVIGQNPRVLKSGDIPPEGYRELWQTISRGRAWRGEFHNRKKNGELYWESAVISPIKDDAGKITNYLAVKEDITERKRVEAERNAMELHLRQAQKLESIGQLAAGIAHEINTPTQFVGDNVRFVQEALPHLTNLLRVHKQLLAAVKGPLLPLESVGVTEASLQMGEVEYYIGELPTAVTESLEGIDRIAHIVRGMKEFSHPTSKDRVAIDLNRAIESTVTVARNEWRYVADLVMALDPKLPLVPCYANEINQVVLNLIVNAAHAIGDVVNTQAGTKGMIRIATVRIADAVEVRVSDTGGGIPEAIRHRIYDPFFTTKEVGKGTGQGLAMAHNTVVKRHGGSLHFESALGQGTTFFVRLPLTLASSELPPECVLFP